MARRIAPVLAVLAVTWFSGAGSAAGAVGDLEAPTCLSGQAPLPACTPIAGATPTGADSGLGVPGDPIVSIDDRSLFVVSRGDAAVARFARGAGGALAYRGCLGSDANSPCDPLPTSAPDGTGTSMGLVQHTAVSPDGRHLYAASPAADAVNRFAIAPDGSLAFADCVTGNTDIPGCATTPNAGAAATDSGLASPEGLVLDPEGRFLYVLLGGDNGIAWFRRGPGGALAYRGCISADSDSTACVQLPFATPSADDTGFDSLRAIAISPDGRSLYLADDSDESVATFTVGRDGAPAFRDCLSGQTTIAPCRSIPTANDTGEDTGMRSLVDVVTSPDGSSVYAISDGDDAIASFDRDPGNGGLTFAGCHSGDSGAQCTPLPGATPGASGSVLHFATTAAVAADARSVYVTGTTADSVVNFARDPADGGLSFRGCFSGNSGVPCTKTPIVSGDGVGSGLDRVRGITVSRDGADVYAAAQNDSAVARMRREPDAAGPGLELEARRKQRGRRVAAKLTCENELCPEAKLKARLTVRVPKRGGDNAVAARKRRFKLVSVLLEDLRPGATERASLKVRKRARRALARAGKGNVRLTARGSDLLDNRTIERSRVKLRSPR